jgi:hypothetical protein
MRVILMTKGDYPPDKYQYLLANASNPPDKGKSSS